MTSNNQNIINLALKFAVDHRKSSFKLEKLYEEYPNRVAEDDIGVLRNIKRLVELKTDKTVLIKTKVGFSHKKFSDYF
jgi:hypothetical protein